MSAVAYVLLPITGLIAYLGGRDSRTRFHGLQAIALGILWPLALYAAGWLSTRATQVVYVLGALVWLGFIGAVLVGRDPRLPFVSGALERAAGFSSSER